MGNWEQRLIRSTEMGRLDGHTHVFRHDLSFASNRRYNPNYSVEITDLVKLLESANLSGAILVQPSFLGNDNSFLLNQLSQAEAIYTDKTFFGVVMMEPDPLGNKITALTEQKCIGHRLNLIDRPVPDVKNAEWRAHFNHLNNAGWHLEIHIEFDRLGNLLDVIGGACNKIVVDHFGRPNAIQAEKLDNFDNLLRRAKENVFLKTSAPYRIFSNLTSNQAAQKIGTLYRMLADNFAQDHLIWGSDWPWTQFEGRHSYANCLQWLDMWNA